MASGDPRPPAPQPPAESSRRRRGRRTTVRQLVLAAAGCWALGQLSVLGIVGLDLRVLVGWTVAAVVVAGAAHVLSPVLRTLYASVLVPVCVLLAFEGGLFFLPSAVVLTAAAVVALPRTRASS